MKKQTSQRNPVLLVHGIFDTGRVFERMVPYLTQRGWVVYDFDLTPNNGNESLDKLAQQIANYVECNFPREQPLDLVGFSMGGIVSRYYVQRLGGISRVQRFITISAPHRGTWIAYSHQGVGCVQMRPDSAFLQDLNRDVLMLKQLNFTSMWTPYDLMIVPANSSQMPLGREVIIPALVHGWMITDTRCLAAVADALAEPVQHISEDRQFEHTPHFRKSPQSNGNT
ncbi:triacylglycerol lipase [Chlorogloeopsis sp. ULAP01]|uniref:esterase/lipase family protein n=1 Tax=Chlorogloeopsis sp. ULAP01 TaxID=3056483 RepID=UPI0025AA4201|nr:triacylglycerol lipase [Chlorogloeopsis sp. ULAP01]MDM9381332.1 triacylglycerol lipase [Chlorogloeopsis sp. ULAP01]